MESITSECSYCSAVPSRRPRSSTTPSVSHTYSTAGSFTAQVKVTDNSGLTATRSVVITANPVVTVVPMGVADIGQLLKADLASTASSTVGDGMVGYAKGAPYAGIISAAGGDAVPETWLDQLAVGGRLIAPTITPAGHQALVVILKTAQGFERQVLEAVHFVPLKSGVA